MLGRSMRPKVKSAGPFSSALEGSALPASHRRWLGARSSEEDSLLAGGVGLVALTSVGIWLRTRVQYRGLQPQLVASRMEVDFASVGSCKIEGVKRVRIKSSRVARGA